MGVPGNANALLLASGGAYQITRSLRFNAGDSANLSQVPSVSGNRTTFTIAFWIKRTKLGVNYQSVFSSGASGGSGDLISFGNDDTLRFWINGGTSGDLKTTQVFRDVSAWMHILYSVDTTQATAANRIKLYVNGTQVTAFGTATYPTQNYQFTSLTTTATRYIGVGYSAYLDGYLAECYYLDGIAADPSSFTTTDLTTGQLIPKAYSGSGYGTNGFQLKFADNSSNTATTLGKDSSGNGNNFTPSNLSVTAGAGNDSLVDVPTNYGTDTGVGGEVRGNYCGANPLDNGGLALANGNLDLSTASSSDLTARGTIGITSGKWYWEVTATNLVADPFNKISVVGIATANSVLPSYVGSNATSWGYVNHNGTKVTNASTGAYGNSWSTNDVIGIAFDADNGKLFFAKNNTWQGSGDPVAGTNAAFTGLTSGPYLPAFNLKNSGASVTINTGARAFAYTAPSGFKALNTANLPAPLVTKPNTLMDVKLYTGNGGTQSITGLAFSPDFVWTKARSFAENNNAFDTVRGATNLLLIDQTNSEQTISGITAFNSDGYTIGSHLSCNSNGQTYVSWNWDAGTSTVSNTQGSITSQVRANPSAGFSVLTYSGANGGTVGHGLGVAPSLVIVKCRSNADGWVTYHKDLGPTNTLQLQSTNAVQTSDTTAFNSTAPSSTLVTLGNSGRTCESGRTYVAYCFAPVSGYSAMGSADGGNPSFVYTGFRPRFLMLKRTNSTSNWHIFDTSRSPYNTSTLQLYANSSSAEDNQPLDAIDFVSNGFVMRSTNSFTGASWIYYAVAESPFQYARAR